MTTADSWAHRWAGLLPAGCGVRGRPHGWLAPQPPGASSGSSSSSSSNSALEWRHLCRVAVAFSASEETAAAHEASCAAPSATALAAAAAQHGRIAGMLVRGDEAAMVRSPHCRAGARTDGRCVARRRSSAHRMRHEQLRRPCTARSLTGVVFLSRCVTPADGQGCRWLILACTGCCAVPNAHDGRSGAETPASSGSCDPSN
jgi:uncharacterized protein involved in type VI secretion and phage assembly